MADHGRSESEDERRAKASAAAEGRSAMVVGGGGTDADADAVPVASAVPASNAVIINVKLPEERTHRVPFRRDGTLAQFRLLVEAATGVPPARQRLIASGRILANEDAPLNLPNEAFVHLAPIGSGSATGTGTSSGGAAPANESPEARARREAYDASGEPDSVVEVQLAALRPGAWVTLIWFALVFWGSLTVLFGGEAKTDMERALTFYDLFMGVAGMLVANLGLRTSQHVGTGERIDRDLVHGNLVRYRAALVLLGTLYVVRIMATSRNAESGGASFIVSFYIVMIFSFCVLQTIRADRALGSAAALMPVTAPNLFVFRVVSPVAVTAPATTAVSSASGTGSAPPVTAVPVVAAAYVPPAQTDVEAQAVPVAEPVTRAGRSAVVHPADADADEERPRPGEPGVFLVGGGSATGTTTTSRAV